MKAIIEGTAAADAPESDLVTIEGNYYFPPFLVVRERPAAGPHSREVCQTAASIIRTRSSCRW
jgi:hypothetical protein